jgi:formylglycine-generating enzyme required for sulfatase activity
VAQRAWARYLSREVEESVDVGSGVTMTFVLVPPGRFFMGSPEKEEGHEDDEVQHEVELTRPFFFGKHAVTQEQYTAITNKPSPSRFSPPARKRRTGGESPGWTRSGSRWRT